MLIAQATQPIWSPDAVNSLVASLTGLFIAIGAVVTAAAALWKQRQTEKTANEAKDSANTTAALVSQNNDRINNVSNAQTTMSDRLTQVAAQVPPTVVIAPTTEKPPQ